MIKRNYFKVMILTLVMAFAFTGCTKELDTDPQVNGPTGDETPQEDMRDEDINPEDSQPDTVETEEAK